MKIECVNCQLDSSVHVLCEVNQIDNGYLKVCTVFHCDACNCNWFEVKASYKLELPK